MFLHFVQAAIAYLNEVLKQVHQELSSKEESLQRSEAVVNSAQDFFESKVFQMKEELQESRCAQKESAHWSDEMQEPFLSLSCCRSVDLIELNLSPCIN